MPIYEYKCTSCGAVEEVLQKVGDSPLKKCRKCGGPMKKLVSSPAIQFKGSGWYVTDYAHKNGAPASKTGDHAAQDKKSPDKKPAPKKDTSSTAPAR
jgi:putative FmdB family regulatory protein